MSLLDDQVWDELVSVERGEVDRVIFSDDEIFERELDMIFARAWHFLCHDTQVQKAGDFFETPVGRDNVLTVRQRDGSIRAFLNTCTHRGNAVCRAEEGNTKAFMCTYHGWSYDLAGNLIGVPDSDTYYKGDLDRSQLGLRQVSQLARYHGFVFATMDPTAPPLEDYLGATGRLGIDLIAARDVEVIPGVQKFTIDCNWKFAVDNLFDWYHPQITHMSAANVMPSADEPGAPTEPDAISGDPGGATNTLGEALKIPSSMSVADGLAVVAEFGHAIAGPTVDGIRRQVDNSWRERPGVADALGPVGMRVAGYPNIFPNTWVASLNLQVSLRVPISAHRTEIWWFTFVEKGASPEERREAVGRAIHVFGPAGLLEQEDGENWAQSTLQTRGVASRRVRQLLKMNLGRGEIVNEHGLARIEGVTSEHGQLWTYRSWTQWMKGLGWEALRSATAPPAKL